MTDLLKKAVATTRLRPAARNHVARTFLHLADRAGEPEAIDAEDVPALLEGLAHAKRRRFAVDAQAEAAFCRFR